MPGKQVRNNTSSNVLSVILDYSSHLWYNSIYKLTFFEILCSPAGQCECTLSYPISATVYEEKCSPSRRSMKKSTHGDVIYLGPSTTNL